ncbi:MAG: restriction endonuclease subunit S [Ruminococcaceae bacterium]|nr:restriction endonuclease subunit S [Oscillospiraceae bacterium]
MIELKDLCTKGSSSIAQKDLEGHDGIYPIYGASGFIKNVDFYQQEKPYIAVVKDGAGVGRVMCLPKESSVIGTMQYIIPNDGVNVKYLAYALEHLNLAKYYTGATIPHIYFKDYCKEKLPAHPPEDQSRIASILGRVTDLIALRKEQLAALDQLVKSRFIELFGDPQRNPYGYQYAKLSDIATYFNGLTYKPENVAEEGTIVLRSSNIQNSQLDFADTVRVDCAIKERLIVQENDILMCSRNGSAKLVGKVALIKGIEEPMSFGAFMMIIRSQYFGYLMTYFQMDAFRQQIKTGATTTINQITGRMLDEVTIPVPPMALVEQFTVFVEQTDKSKLAIQRSLDELETLKKALMQKYFG